MKNIRGEDGHMYIPLAIVYRHMCTMDWNGHM